MSRTLVENYSLKNVKLLKMLVFISGIEINKYPPLSSIKSTVKLVSSSQRQAPDIPIITTTWEYLDE